MKQPFIGIFSFVLLVTTLSNVHTSKTRALDTRSFVVIGEGLAAGIGDFSLTEEVQRGSFPALMARQFGVAFSQPLIQSPGLGNVPGLNALPLVAPAPQQTTVLSEFPIAKRPNNLSIPGFRVEDSWLRRPVSPLLQNHDPQQSLINLILGELGTTSSGSLSQLDHALRLKPTFVIVELGYHEVIQAVVAGDVKHLPDPATFSANYSKLVRTLRKKETELMLMTIPDPSDTAYLASLEVAGRLVKTDPGLLQDLYKLQADDLITVPGMMEIGYQLTGRNIDTSLKEGFVLSTAKANEITLRVEALNREIWSLARDHRAVVYDLNKFFKKVKREGIKAGSTRLNGDFLWWFLPA